MTVISLTSGVPAAVLAQGEEGWTDNWTVGGTVLRGEIMDASGCIWLAQEPMTIEQYEALQLPEGFHRSGVGVSCADWAYFRRSPLALVDGPLEAREVSGVRFARVALPSTAVDPGVSGALVLPVYKYHRVFYRAGRTIEIADFGDGWDYVPQAVGCRLPGTRWDEPLPPRVLPEGWSVREVTLSEDLTVDLPHPTRVCILASGESFMGPIRLGL